MKTITIAGNMGRDAETRAVGDTTVTNGSVAVRHWTKEDPDGTMWFKFAVWGKRGESVAHLLTKGRSVAVTGDLDVDHYTSKDGEQRFSLVVNNATVTLLNKPGGASDPAPKQETKRDTPPPDASSSSNGFESFSDDEIPF